MNREPLEVILRNYADDRDLPWVVDPERWKERVAAEERGYRRGYWHGYSTAMDDALAAGAKGNAWWNKLASFFDGRLARWYRGDCTTLELPPALRRQPAAKQTHLQR
jgi:hypothetical protein